jgi:hypothetical protein
MKTLLKITGGILAGILLLVVLALLVVNNHYVQNMALKDITRILSEKMQMPVKADSISFNIFTVSANLHGVSLELPKGKKNETFVDIASLRLRGKRVDIKGLRFRTENHLPRKNTNKPKRGWFDAGHLDLTANLRLSVNYLEKDSISISIIEGNVIDSISGFDINDLHMNITSDLHRLHVTDAVIQQVNTVIHIPSTEVQLPSKKKGIPLKYYTTAPLTAHVILQDISHLFAKALEQFTMPLELSVMVEGDADSMQFKDIEVKNEDNRLHINADGGIENLRSKYLLNISFHIDEMLAKGDVKREIIDQFIVKKFMMPQLSKLGDIHYKGDFSILRKREVFSGRISTAAGQLNLINLTINDSTKYISGKLWTPALEIGEVMEMKDLGKIVADASFEFDISKERTAQVRKEKGGKLPIGSVKAKVKEAKYKIIKFKNVDVDIVSDGALAEGNLEADGSFAKTSLSFSFDDTKEMHKMKIKPKIKIHFLSSKKTKKEG